jgi:hypothetical protein
MDEAVPNEHKTVIIGGPGPEGPEIYGELKLYAIIAKEPISPVQ